jgi:hypothetical protein
MVHQRGKAGLILRRIKTAAKMLPEPYEKTFADKIPTFVFEYRPKIHFNDLAKPQADNFRQNFT